MSPTQVAVVMDTDIVQQALDGFVDIEDVVRQWEKAYKEVRPLNNIPYNAPFFHKALFFVGICFLYIRFVSHVL